MVGVIIGTNPYNEQENFIMYQIDFQKPLAVHFIGIGGYNRNKSV